jgi:putative AlgH/UPF0301 family transcriptional regulator
MLAKQQKIVQTIYQTNPTQLIAGGPVNHFRTSVFETKTESLFCTRKKPVIT